MFNGFKQFTDGITDTKTAMWILLGGNALNIVGNYILINGKLGFPEMPYNGNPIKTNGYRFLYLGKDKNFI